MATSSHPSVWQLSLYEQNRQPHQVITDKTKIAISPRSLHNELMCPICLDILKNTMCTKECLHRFCQECIITALRSGNKECPTCRKKLVSKRSLRSDPNIDELIAKIFPKREEYEAHQEEMMLKRLQNIRQKKTRRKQGPASRKKRAKLERLGSSSSSSSNGDNASSSSESEDKYANTDTQSQKKENVDTTNNDDSILKDKTVDKQTSSSCSSSTTTTTTTTAITTAITMTPLDLQSEIELIFKPRVISTHPELSTSLNKERYIKTKAYATIDHLSKYLSDRIALESTKPPGNKKDITKAKPETAGKFNIFIKPGKTGKEFLILEGSQNLSEIYTKHWHSKKPLELYYAKE